MHKITPAFSFLLLTLSIAVPPGAHGTVEFFTPFNTFDFGTWDGQGSPTLSQTACIRSETGNKLANYRLKAAMNPPAPSTSTPFTLYQTVDPGHSLPAVLELTDLYTSGTQTLTADVFSSDMSACNLSNPPNARLDMTLQASDLYTLPTGTYEVSLDLEARRVNNGGGLTGDSAVQSGLIGRITLPPLVRIANMDDIPLGTHGVVVANVSSNEPYCVYSNTESYTITPSGAAGSSPGSFALSSGGNLIEYSVRISDTADASAGAQLANGQTSATLSSNQSTPYSITCSGGDNAAVYVEITVSELQGKPAGTYSSTLTLQIAPI